MKRSDERILTTHQGNLPKPLEQAAALSSIDAEARDQALPVAVSQVVRRQVESGIDIVNDGELSKSGFYQYAIERLSGFEQRRLAPGQDDPTRWGPVLREEALVGDYFRRKGAPFARGTLLAPPPLPTHVTVCTGPVTYTGQAQLERDIANFKVALADGPGAEGFLPASSPGVLASTIVNEYYPTKEAYVLALADALHYEYQGIVDAGLVLQIDAPDVASNWQRTPGMTLAEYRPHAEMLIDAINRALLGIPASRVRFHMCWASWHGPHVTDLPLEDFIDVILKVHADGISLEAANPRHEADWHVWERIKLPPGKTLIPGVVGHYSDFVEHPRAVADRLVRFARVVGRENVIAGTDCGIGSRVGDPWIAWAKLEAMAQGARLATRELWG